MLIEEVLDIVQDNGYRVSITLSDNQAVISVHDNQLNSSVSETTLGGRASTVDMGREILAQIYLYENKLLVGRDTLAKLEPWAQSNYLPDSEHTERIVDRMAEAIAGATLENATQPEDVMGTVDPTELLATDEVSEARMSYYWVYNRDMQPVHIEVKVDEYREVVKARYVSNEKDVCPGCAGYGVPCNVFHGTQEQLDGSTWITVGSCVNLLPTKYQLIQKLPSEIAYDLRKAEANDN